MKRGPGLWVFFPQMHNPNGTPQQHTQAEEYSKTQPASTPQGHKKQGKPEELSQIRRDCGNKKTKCNVVSWNSLRPLMENLVRSNKVCS